MIVSRQQLPGIVQTGHVFDLPLDPDAPGGPGLRVFARELVAADKADAALPTLLFLQGGPGGESPRPSERGGWIGRALDDYRVLLLDQRGTGLSSPLSFRTLAGLDPETQAERLTHYRADAIVRDAEAIRRELLGDEPWSVLGQSFGGFCALTYLSLAPEGLREVFIAGGLPALDRHPDEIYRACYRTLRGKNDAFAAAWPEAQAKADALARVLRRRTAAGDPVTLPDGSPLTVARLQHLGIRLGASDGAATLGYLLERIEPGDDPSYAFLSEVLAATGFQRGPIYALLHEAIYCQGFASAWSAERVRAESPELDDPDGPLRFSGEMIYPWLFDQVTALAPLGEAAEILAAKDDWGLLYDPERLEANRVPVAAVAYLDDMYVPYAFSKETAERVGNVRLWATNEYEHNGLRADGARILERLMAMVRGSA